LYLHIDENDRPGGKVKIFLSACAKIVVDPELSRNKGTSSGTGHFQDVETYLTAIFILLMFY